MTQPSGGPAGNSAPSVRSSSSVRSFTSSCSMSRCTVAPAERHPLGHLEPEAERARHVHAGEVLAQVAQHVGIVAAGGEDVDEAEELGLEARVGHRPVEHPLAPAPEVEEVRPLRRPGRRDLPGEGLHLVLEAVAHGGSQPRRAASSRFRKRPTSVTMPVDSTEPRSASLVTTAGLMSTQMSRTPAGVTFPTPIEWSMEKSMRIMSAPSISRAYSACAATRSTIVSGSGPSSRIEPASAKGTPWRTHSYMTPLRTAPASTACRMPPCARTRLI